jgi:hypothetical protein
MSTTLFDDEKLEITITRFAARKGPRFVIRVRDTQVICLTPMEMVQVAKAVTIAHMRHKGQHELAEALIAMYRAVGFDSDEDAT